MGSSGSFWKFQQKVGSILPSSLQKKKKKEKEKEKEKK